MNFQSFEFQMLTVVPPSGLLAWVYSWGNLAWDWTFVQNLVSFPSCLFLFSLEASCDATIRTTVLCFMLRTSDILICHCHHHPYWVSILWPLTSRTSSELSSKFGDNWAKIVGGDGAGLWVFALWKYDFLGWKKERIPRNTTGSWLPGP